MPMTQSTRRLQLTTVLGPDALLLKSFSGEERMSRLFSYQLDLISENPSIEAQSIVGSPIGWSSERGDGSRRHWHGFVQSLSRGDVDLDGRRSYQIEVVPWLWFLSQTSDCKIFQDKTLPNIISEVLADFPLADFKTDFQLDHKKWGYCVQYRETDFNFLSRLMEHEGIFYYFEHSQGAHKMVLTDHKNGYHNLPESKVDLPRDVSSSVAKKDHLLTWKRSFQFVSGKFAQRDYNFKTPTNDLQSDCATVVKLPEVSKYELYDYPGAYPDKKVGGDETKLRMEAVETRHETVEASSFCRTFQVGGTFEVGDHPDAAEKGAKLVITSITHTGSEPLAYETGSESQVVYENTFSCIPASVVFRPAQSTVKPAISGIQTAIVTGPDGEEIYPDEYGRVKCQFHWDRYGKDDEKSSCWIRVSQGHAGAGFGFSYLPRIGEEVVVSFLEGDPDRPLITGRVYHHDNKPHYPLPDHKTRMTLRTNSTKGGDGFNELTFEDLKDDERLYMQAERNMDTRVKNHSREFIYGDRDLIIGSDDAKEKGGNLTELVEKDKHQLVKGNHVEQIEGDHELRIGGAGGNLDVKIDKQRTETIGAGNDRTVSKDENVKVGGTLSETIGQDHQTKVGMKQAVDAGMEIHLKAGMKVILEAGVQISLVVGGSFIDINPSGVTIQGPLTRINCGGVGGKGSGAKPSKPKSAKVAKPKKAQEAWKPDH